MPSARKDCGKARSTEDALLRNHEFVRDDEKDRQNWNSWETRMAARYYRKLHKEYAIVDLSRWHEGVCGLRWRTEREVLAGIGEESCASKGCTQTRRLRSFEVPFIYTEDGDANKCELVKVRVCEECGRKLSCLGCSKQRRNKRRRLDQDDCGR